MFRVQGDGAQEAGQLGPRQGVLQTQIAASVSHQEPLGLQSGGRRLLSACGLCGVYGGSCQQGGAQYDCQELGNACFLFHLRFLRF